MGSNPDARELAEIFGDASPADSFDRERSRQRVTSALLGDRDEAPKIGPFFVLERLGEGGMGVVYAGFDPRLGRKVAIKVLHPGRGDSRHGSSEGILREARALARLSHPNVVAVHEVGTHDRGVFLAMEFVDGQTLAQWMRAEKREWQELLAYVRAAGQGLQAAHDAGLVHRDFKPDNALIGRDGVVKVADFGLARSDGATAPTNSAAQLTDSPIEQLTQTGAVVGTPRYMAPEQHLGLPVGPAADQYALCLTLVEGLLGRFPLGDTLAEVVERKTSGDRPRVEHVPGWLQRAIDRGLSPEPGDRFEKMADLLAALTPPRRGRAVWASVLAIGGVGIAAFAVASNDAPPPAAEPTCPDFSAEIAEDWSEETRTEVEASIDASGALAGREMAATAIAGLDRYAQAWADARAEVCERELDKRDPSAVSRARADCLSHARIELRARVGVLRSLSADQIPHLAEIVGTLPPPSTCVADEVAFARNVEPPDPAHRETRDRGLAAVASVNALIMSGKLDEARTQLAVVQSDFADAMKDDPFLAYKFHRAQAAAADGEDRIGHAYETLAAAIEGGADGEVVDAYIELANRLWDMRKFEEAERVLGLGLARSAAFRQRALSERGQQLANEAEGTLRMTLGDVYRNQGRTDEAIASLTRSLELLEDTAAPDWLKRAKCTNNLAETYRETGQYSRALELFNDAIGLAEEAYGVTHPAVATMFNNRAAVAMDTGRLSEGRRDLERALDITLRTVGPNAPNAGLIHFNLGMIASTYGDTATARPQYERAREIWHDAQTFMGPLKWVAVAALGTVAHREGNADESLRLHAEAVDQLRPALKGSHPVLAQVIAEHGTTLLEMGRAGEAKKLTGEAVAMMEKTHAIDSYGGGAVILIDAHAALKLGDTDAAAAGYARALETIEAMGNPLHPGLASVYAGLAEVARRREQEADATRYHARMQEVEKAHPGLANWAGTAFHESP